MFSKQSVLHQILCVRTQREIIRSIIIIAVVTAGFSGYFVRAVHTYWDEQTVHYVMSRAHASRPPEFSITSRVCVFASIVDEFIVQIIIPTCVIKLFKTISIYFSFGKVEIKRYWGGRRRFPIMSFTHNGPFWALFFFSSSPKMSISENVDTPQLHSSAHSHTWRRYSRLTKHVPSESDQNAKKQITKNSNHKSHIFTKSTESTAANRIFIFKKSRQQQKLHTKEPYNKWASDPIQTRQWPQTHTHTHGPRR